MGARLKKQLQSCPKHCLTITEEESWSQAGSCWICKQDFVRDWEDQEKLPVYTPIDRKLASTVHRGCKGRLSSEFATCLSTALVADEVKLFNQSYRCRCCGGSFIDEWLGQRKVRDHCHLTGEYRGAAHSKCNLSIRENYKIPVFVHNLKDAHLLFREMGLTGAKPKIIATNTEKYVSFSIDNLVFKDSCQFLQLSLDKLARADDSLLATSALVSSYGLQLSAFQEIRRNW